MEKRRIKVRYTVVIEIDEELDTDVFHNSLTSEMLNMLR